MPFIGDQAVQPVASQGNLVTLNLAETCVTDSLLELLAARNNEVTTLYHVHSDE